GACGAPEGDGRADGRRRARDRQGPARGRARGSRAITLAQGRRLRTGHRQMNVLVQTRGVTKTYRRGGETIEVLHGIDLDIPRGDFVALMGPSASGNPTLLNLPAALDPLASGTIVVAGQRLARLGGGDLARCRAAHVGFVFRFYSLLPLLPAQRNVELPLLLTSLSAA